MYKQEGKFYKKAFYTTLVIGVLLFSPIFMWLWNYKPMQFTWLEGYYPTQVYIGIFSFFLALESALTSVLTFTFLRRFFAKVKHLAYVGIAYGLISMLLYSIFFKSNHEILFLTPLIFISLEELFVNIRKGGLILSLVLTLFLVREYAPFALALIVCYVAFSWWKKRFPLNKSLTTTLIVELLIALSIGNFLLIPLGFWYNTIISLLGVIGGIIYLTYWYRVKRHKSNPNIHLYHMELVDEIKGNSSYIDKIYDKIYNSPEQN